MDGQKKILLGGERGFNIFLGKISIPKGMAEGVAVTVFWTCRPNGWPQKILLVGTFKIGGFNTCSTSKNVNTPFNKTVRE